MITPIVVVGEYRDNFPKIFGLPSIQVYIDRVMLCRYCEPRRFFCFFCVHLVHTFLDSLFSATVYVGFASMFYWAGMGKECKI